jgi:hypothetical protein
VACSPVARVEPALKLAAAAAATARLQMTLDCFSRMGIQLQSVNVLPGLEVVRRSRVSRNRLIDYDRYIAISSERTEPL